MVLQAKPQNLTLTAKAEPFGSLVYILPTSRILHQHVSTHLQECGEEGREEQVLCSSSWKRLVPPQLQASTDHLRLEQLGAGEAPGRCRCFRSELLNFTAGLTKNLGVRSAEIQVNTNNEQEQRPCPKV